MTDVEYIKWQIKLYDEDIATSARAISRLTVHYMLHGNAHTLVTMADMREERRLLEQERKALVVKLEDAIEVEAEQDKAKRLRIIRDDHKQDRD